MVPVSALLAAVLPCDPSMASQLLASPLGAEHTLVVVSAPGAVRRLEALPHTGSSGVPGTPPSRELSVATAGAMRRAGGLGTRQLE